MNEQGLQLETENTTLPEIPNGFVRLTHFTSESIAERLINGESFTYEDQGFLSFTTDLFTNNSEVQTLIETGNTGPYERVNKGDVVVLIDMNPLEYKQRCLVGVDHQSIVPNSNILGYVKRAEPKILIKNLRYDPKVNNIETTQHSQRPPQTDIPVPSSTGSSDIDSW